MTKNVTYYAIKVRDRYLTKIGCYLTEDLGQARLYRNLDNWERKSLEIIEKLKENYGDYIYEELMIVLIEVKEIQMAKQKEETMLEDNDYHKEGGQNNE